MALRGLRGGLIMAGLSVAVFACTQQAPPTGPAPGGYAVQAVPRFLGPPVVRPSAGVKPVAELSKATCLRIFTRCRQGGGSVYNCQRLYYQCRDIPQQPPQRHERAGLGLDADVCVDIYLQCRKGGGSPHRCYLLARNCEHTSGGTRIAGTAP